MFFILLIIVTLTHFQLSNIDVLELELTVFLVFRCVGIQL